MLFFGLPIDRIPGDACGSGSHVQVSDHILVSSIIHILF